MPAVQLDPELEALVDGWFSGKKFSADWVKPHIAVWDFILAPLRAKPLSILEIGSYEGRSTIFFLEYFPNSTITCVDTFDSALALARGREPRFDPREAQFDFNVAAYGDRVTKIKARSAVGLDRLRMNLRRFDLIYVDGGHLRKDVLLDSISAWFLLRVGGILIWDDFELSPELPSNQRPMDAIKLFLNAFEECYVLLHRGYQVIVQKSAEWPGEQEGGKAGAL